MKPQLLCQKHRIKLCSETIWQCSGADFHFVSYKTSSEHHEACEQSTQSLKRGQRTGGRPAKAERSGIGKREWNRFFFQNTVFFHFFPSHFNAIHMSQIQKAQKERRWGLPSSHSLIHAVSPQATALTFCSVHVLQHLANPLPIVMTVFTTCEVSGQFKLHVSCHGWSW